MTIRVKTLRELARTGKSVYRVRFRSVVEGPDGKPLALSDGEPRKPWTWSQWDDDFYTTGRLADRGCFKDMWVERKVRPPGEVDLVPARDAWKGLVRKSESDPTLLDDIARGRLQLVAPDLGILACDERRAEWP
jgi:hypothetical protein